MHFQNSERAREDEMEWRTGRGIEVEVRKVTGVDLVAFGGTIVRMWTFLRLS